MSWLKLNTNVALQTTQPRQICPNDSSSCRKAGHNTPSIGRLTQLLNYSSCRKSGHVASSIGWLNYSLKVSFCRQAGHATSSVDWLTCSPNDSSWRRIDHANPAMGELKHLPNSSFYREVRPLYSVDWLITFSSRGGFAESGHDTSAMV